LTYSVRVRAFNDRGPSPPLWFGKVGAHDTNFVTSALDFTTGAQRAQTQCFAGLDECSEDTEPSGTFILARGLPGRPPLAVPGYPTVDTPRAFTVNSGLVYFGVPPVNGNGVDKWRVEWSTDPQFSESVKFEVVSTMKYNIAGLITGTTYYIRVIAHSTAGYGKASLSYPFIPRQQPDAPYAPAVSVAANAPNLISFARSVNVSWEAPQIISPDLVGSGGNAVNGYLIEWSKAPFADFVGTVQVISLPCGVADAVGAFQVQLDTTADTSSPHPVGYFTYGQFPNPSKFVSADIPAFASASEIKVILQNMPNIAEVTVEKSSTATTQSWSITFHEGSDVPLLTVVESSATCYTVATMPSIAYETHALTPAGALYSWMNISADFTQVNGPINYVIENLLPGETYFIRVSARNDLGFGSRRLTAPPSITVPVTQPSIPTQKEGDWAPPRLFSATATSALVKIGPSAFDGGSLITTFHVQWDTAATFDSSPSGDSLGSVAIPAYSVICQSCVTSISFVYSANPTVVITYDDTIPTTTDRLRKLQTGYRVGIITSDDNVPYTFVIANASASATSFIVRDAGWRELDFSSGVGVDLYLLGAEFEIEDLTPGIPYFVRVAAENNDGVCSNDMHFIGECGSFIRTSPSSIIPREAPDVPTQVKATVVDATSVSVSWRQPLSTSPIESYRVDAFTRSSSATAAQSSFFGDLDVQMLSTVSSDVRWGTFTLAFDAFSVALPGTVNAFNRLRYFNTSEDLTSFLEPGDQIMVDGIVYTIAPASYFLPGSFFVLERIDGAGLNSDVIASKIYARPKTLPIPFNVPADKLTKMIQDQADFGQVKVERTQGLLNGYQWTITFMTNVGKQPKVIVNPLQLGGPTPVVTVTKVVDGVAPDNFQSKIVTRTDFSFSSLSTGATWYFRVLASNAVGDGFLSELVSAVPASAPLSVSHLEVNSLTGSSLAAQFSMDADSMGSKITQHNLYVESSTKNFTVQIPVSYQVQRVVTAAHTLPFASGSVFTLSMGNYNCCYFSYVAKNSSSFNLVDVAHGDTFLTKSSVAHEKGWQSLHNYVGPGEFIRIGRQEFRVCLNQDVAFVAANHLWDESYIPLCDLETAMTAVAFDAGFASHLLEFQPVYKLDTAVGFTKEPMLGSSVINVNYFDGTVNPNVAALSHGDWLMLGHPTRGEEFRVLSVTSSQIVLGTTSDPSVVASVSVQALQHSTYEVQTITLASTANLSPAIKETGFRIRFNQHATFVTEIGGYFGCLTLGSTAADVRTELIHLLSIDDVAVTRSEGINSVTFTVTFIGDLVRGNVRMLEILDIGNNGCNLVPVGAVTAVVDDIRQAYLPIYRLQTTSPLPFNCEADEMKDALEALTSVARVDVTKSVDRNGYAWMVTFRSFSEASSVNVPLLKINSVSIAAAVNGAAYTYPVGEAIIPNLIAGQSYFFKIAPVNAKGIGRNTTSTPTSKQPSDQVPSAPLNVLAHPGAASTILIQFNAPKSTGGPPITHYRVQYDAFNSYDTNFHNATEEIIILSTDTAQRRGDVQVVSLVSEYDFHPRGTFVLTFLGQRTEELDYNISAAGLKNALERLSTVKTVDVRRELYCTQEAGQNNCGDNRGYNWIVTFVDVIDNGFQYEQYLDEYESNFNYRLQVSGKYLVGCKRYQPSLCYTNGSTSVFINSIQELQLVVLCSNTDTPFSIGQISGQATGILNSQMSMEAFASAIESAASGIGHILVTPYQSYPSGHYCPASSVAFMVTFSSYDGDVPLIQIASGEVKEIRKGVPQYVNGLGDYSIALQRPYFAANNEVYFRVAAVNSVGTSAFVSPNYNPIKFFSYAPNRPLDVNVIAHSETELLVSWSPPLFQSSVSINLTHFIVEYDSNSAFNSRCSDNVCDPTNVAPLHSVVVDGAYNSVVLGRLVPGQSYFVRVRGCAGFATDLEAATTSPFDKLCSGFSFMGFPEAPIAAKPYSVPLVVTSANVTLLDSKSISVSWAPPTIRAEGVNGLPVSGYAVKVSTPRNKVHRITILDATALFAESFSLTYASTATTRCMSTNVSAFEMEYKIEELSLISSVSVVFNTAASSRTRRVFDVVFEGSQTTVVVDRFTSSSTVSCKHESAIISNEIVVSEIRAFEPEIVKIVTAPLNPTVSGSFEVRYGFRGEMVKAAYVSDYSAVITVSAIAGQRVFVASSSLSHLLTSGVVVRIMDEEVTVETVSTDGLRVTFYPYLTHAASNAILFISETLLGSASLNVGGNILTTTASFASEVTVGDFLYISKADYNTHDEASYAVATVSAVTSTSIALVAAVSITGSSLTVALYKQQSVLLPYDASVLETEISIEELAAVGSVEVTRHGPTATSGYTWYVTFTSAVEPMDCQTKSCMSVSSLASSGFSLSTGVGSVCDGSYVSTGYVNGRRAYKHISGPFFVIWDSKWMVYSDDVLNPIYEQAAASTSILPVIAGLTFTFSSGAVVSAASLGSLVPTLSVVQDAVSPSLSAAVPHMLQTSVKEIQSLSITTSNGLIFGGFNLDWNASGIAVYFRNDESAEDFKVKFESLPTVGIVSVSRALVTDTVSGALRGYKWSITFETNQGDLPLITYSVVPVNGLPLAGLGAIVPVVVASVVQKGVYFPIVAEIGDLMSGSQYTVQVLPISTAGEGASSITVQNDGMGVIPMSFNLIGEPSAPILISAAASSASQIALHFAPSQDNGGSKIRKYAVEYTTNATGAFRSSVRSFGWRMYNEIHSANDTEGYWRVSFTDSWSTLLPWGATADQVASALNDFPALAGVFVTVNPTAPRFGQGFEYVVRSVNEIGSLVVDTRTIKWDTTLVTSKSLTQSIVVEQFVDDAYSVPTDYDVQWINSDCNNIQSGSYSSHQVVSITSATADLPGSGSFKLNFGDSTLDQQSTVCLPFTMTAADLKSALLDLNYVNDVVVETHKRSTGASSGTTIDYHVFFEGVFPTVDWPLLRADPEHLGINQNPALFASSCVSKQYSTTSVKVTSISDNMGCSDGISETQTIVVEAMTTPSGFFYLYLNGHRTDAIAVSASAGDVERAINSLTGISGVSVTKYIHSDTIFSGCAWVVTFPATYGDVETFGIDDKYVTGTNAAVNVYPTLNISMIADNYDISGHFQIAIGKDSSVPLSFAATEGAVLSALQNLSAVGKVAFLGTREFESDWAITFAATVLSTSTMSLAANYSTSIAVGDEVRIAGVSLGYIKGLTFTASSTILQLPTFAYAGSQTITVGKYHLSKIQLPGVVSVQALATVYTATYNSNQMITATHFADASIYVLGELYSVTANVACPSNTAFRCLTLNTAYLGPTTFQASVPVHIFPLIVTLTPTSSWATYSQITTNTHSAIGSQRIWIGDAEIPLLSSSFSSSPSYSLTASGQYISYPFEAAVAFVWGYGVERVLVFKETIAPLSSARVSLESDFRGTNVRVNVKRSDGILPGTFVLGGLSEVQTVAFRSASLADTNEALDHADTFQLVVGDETTAPLLFGSSPMQWKAALESLAGVDRVTVERSGDGLSAMWSYGYVYTVTFWGPYGVQGVPQLSTINSASSLVNILHDDDTIREAEYLADFSSRHLALNSGMDYAVRLRAVNDAGLSVPSQVLNVHTDVDGALPSAPQTLVLGAYKTATSLSLSFNPVQDDGGLPITSYTVESDVSGVFDPSSQSYQSQVLQNVPEIQQIVIAFRSGDDVKVRGGTFTVTLGGRTSPNIPFDISAADLQVTLNVLLGLRRVALPPVSVTRTVWNRGFKWLVTFSGINGDIGLIQVDPGMLLGDDPRMEVSEVVRGFGDIVPGQFTYEVQTIRTDALSNISGTFVLTMEGYQTEEINWNDDHIQFHRKLESIPTIYTVKVSRTLLNKNIGAFAWTVTFAHMKREVVQGAGDIPPLTVHSSALLPTQSATIHIFELIKGTHPLRFDIHNLQPGSTVLARVTAYNERGYSLRSTIASSTVLGQPPMMSGAFLSVASAESLNVSWIATPGVIVPSSSGVSRSGPIQVAISSGSSFKNAYDVNGFMIEWYTSSPVPEIQVITTSASGSLQEVQRITVDSDKNNLAGYFRLEFNGETTSNIPWNAYAEGDNSVALHLARLSSVGAVSVTRLSSRRLVQGVRVNATLNAGFATCVDGNTSSLAKGDVLWISGQKFTVLSLTASVITFDNSATFEAPTVGNAKLFKWSYGFTWDVTFTSLIGDVSELIPSSSDNWAGTNPVLKVVTTRQGVPPLSGTFRVGFRGTMSPPIPFNVDALGMKSVLEQLDTIGQVDVVRYPNGFGFDWEVTFLSEIGNVDSLYVNDAALQGPYAIATVSTSRQGVAPENYGVKVLSNPSLYSAVIDGLELGTLYQVRVSAFNSAGSAYPLIADPVFMAPKTYPSVPFNATLIPLSSTVLKVVWMAPRQDGGDFVTQYRVEWALNADFTNSEVRYVSVSPISGPSYCYNIPILSTSALLPRFARIFAFNGFAWSLAGYPTPRFASGVITAPGAPLRVRASPTSNHGINVVWDAPGDMKCEFGGDGGAPVTHYVVEWDVREDFGSPASKATVFTLDNLSFNIGGRNISTGVISPILLADTAYFVRVTAFNGRGAGIAGFAELGSVTAVDQPPDAPIGLQFWTTGPESIQASWQTPKKDGGVTLEKYRLEYSSSPDFEYFEALDLPLVSEVQTVVAQSDVVIETQAIRVTAAVTNEKQTVRSRVTGIDEIQTVTTTCDDVTNEVQRVTTNAGDIDEIQTIELIGTDVNEVQLVQTRTVDDPEVQVIEISATRVSAVQTIGLIIRNVNTASCAVGASCDAIEDYIQGSFSLRFDVSQCGTSSDFPDSNWCYVALKEMGWTNMPTCSGTECTSTLINIKNGADGIKDAVCSIVSAGSATTFMQDSNGDCVTIAANSYVATSASLGTYVFSYDVTFSGDTLRGYIPPLEVMYTNVTFVKSGETPIYASTIYYNSANVSLGALQTSGSYAFTKIAGNQPNGQVQLTYTCESSSVPITATVTALGVTVTRTTGAAVFAVNQFLRLGTTYHLITAVSNAGLTATITPSFFSNSLTTSASIVSVADAEYGVFYSDPTTFSGVSVACLQQRTYQTSNIFPFDTDADIRTKILALSDVISQVDGSILVERSYFPSSNAAKVGYFWTVTFVRQHGNVNTLQCSDSALSPTNSDSDAFCLVTTTTEGSLITGTMDLGMTYPHAYDGTPLPIYTDTSGISWNIKDIYLASILSAEDHFGTVGVSRVSYIPSNQKRWSGGYRWTVEFFNRNGELPAILNVNSLSGGSGRAATIEIGTQKLAIFDDPLTAVTGNQVSGYFGLVFRDQFNKLYNTTTNAFPVVSPTTGQAISAAEMQAYLVTMFGSTGIVTVTRSSGPNSAMGYTYSVQFVGENVGGTVVNFKPLTNLLTSTSIAAPGKQIGVLCSDSSKCVKGTYVVITDVVVQKARIGAQLSGTFQLRYNGYVTGPLPYNAEASVVAAALNNLISVSPSEVVVTREGPMITPDTQVFGYVWSITFNSNRWVDPTISHETFIPGNWIGSPASWTDVWPSGFSKAWGKNVGDVPPIECVATSLYVTNGGLPGDGCDIEEVVPGTPPLKGSFELTLDTTTHTVINVQSSITTLPIAHNAPANATESGGDGTSLQELLQGLDNVGDIAVHRSDVNPKNGGYTWTITFLRDKAKVAGQFGNDCQQRDSFEGLCNSPGNVPPLTFNVGTLSGACLDNGLYTCPLITILTGDSPDGTEPPGSKSVQRIYIDNPDIDAAMATNTFNISMDIGGTVFATSCLSVHATAATVESAINAAFTDLDRGVHVSRVTDTAHGRNGGVFTFLTKVFITQCVSSVAQP